MPTCRPPAWWMITSGAASGSGKKRKGGAMALQFFETFTGGYELFQRYQKGAAFRGYVKRHGVEILVAGLVLVGIAIACAGATIVFAGGRSSWRVLLALIAAPIVL